jgi:hypothetical protein
MDKRFAGALCALLCCVMTKAVYAPPPSVPDRMSLKGASIQFIEKPMFRGFFFSVAQGFESWGTPVHLVDSIQYSDTFNIHGFRGGVGLGFFLEIYKAAFFWEVSLMSTPMKEVNVGRILDKLQPMMTIHRGEVSAIGTLGMGSKLTRNTAMFLVGSVELNQATVDTVRDPEAFMTRFADECVEQDPAKVVPGGTIYINPPTTGLGNPAIMYNTGTPPAPANVPGAPTVQWATAGTAMTAPQGLKKAVTAMNADPSTMVRKRFLMMIGRLGFRIASMVHDDVSFQIEFAGRWSRITMPSPLVNTIKPTGVDCQIRLGYHF